MGMFGIEFALRYALAQPDLVSATASQPAFAA